MTESKDAATEFTTGVLLTMTTGKMLAASFADVHHAADVVMGQPLMTQNFASERLAEDMRRSVERQHPWTADVSVDDFPALDGLTREQAEQACRGWVQQFSDEHGERHVLLPPPETRRVPLVEGLPAKFGGAS